MDVMGGACSVCGGSRERHIEVWWVELKEGDGLKRRCKLKNNIKVDIK